MRRTKVKRKLANKTRRKPHRARTNKLNRKRSKRSRRNTLALKGGGIGTQINNMFRLVGVSANNFANIVTGKPLRQSPYPFEQPISGTMPYFG